MRAVPARPSLITHSAAFLREALERGDWSGFLPSERVLSLRMRISRPTLRAVLTQLENEGSIGRVEARRRRILARPPRGVLSKQVKVIALLSPVPAQAMPPFVLFWMDALRAVLSEAGCLLELHVDPRCFSNKPASALRRATAKLRAAAWLLFRSNAAVQRWFADHSPLAVVAGSCAPGIKLPSVDIDYRSACRHAAITLRRAGHRKIALLLPEGAHGGDQESALGFLEAAGDSGLVLRHRGTQAQLIACVEAGLATRPPPTAFLVARSLHALTAITHLQRTRRRVPEDIAVVSRDSDDFLTHVVPAVTCYAVDPSKFARSLARLVLDVGQTGHASERPVRLVPELQRGGSA